jgi:hypothetical protein
MPNCKNYNCGETADHDNVIDLCASETRNAGNQNFILIECNDTLITDPTNASQILAAVAAGTAKKVENIKLGFDEPSVVNAPTKTKSCGTIPVVNRNRSVTWEDYNVTLGNADFYNDVNNRTYGGMIVFNCSTDDLDDLAFYIDSEITINSFLNNGNDNDLPMFWTAKANWSKKADPEMILAPAGVFS